jgi:Flp pilus assembly protein CpaB
MRHSYGNRGSLLGPILLGGTLLLTGLLVTVGVLAATGRIELPFLARKRPALPPAGQPEGTIAVLVTTQKIPAYTRLTRDHFWDPKTGQFSVVYLYPSEVLEGMLTNLDQVRGRVLAVDKNPGYAVNESELLPKGTRAGLAGGIPAGKRAMVLEASRLHGIHGLKLGDHVDLIASVLVDAKPPAGRDARSLLLSLKQPSSELGATGAKKQARIVVLAEDAVIVLPPTIRHLPSQTPPKAKEPDPKGKPVEEVVIAVDPEEVARVSEALGVDAAITAVAHSGRPDAPKGSIKPAPAEEPPAGPTVIEVIRGGKRTTLIFAPDGTKLGESPGSPDVIPTTETTVRR